MKIAILSRNPEGYSNRRLKQAAAARGFQLRILDTLQFSIQVEQRTPDLYFRGKRVGRYDAVIPRIGASFTFFGTAVVRQFEQMGVSTLNSSHAISVSRDKLLCFGKLLTLRGFVPVKTRRGKRKAAAGGAGDRG